MLLKLRTFRPRSFIGRTNTWYCNGWRQVSYIVKRSRINLLARASCAITIKRMSEDPICITFVQRCNHLLHYNESFNCNWSMPRQHFLVLHRQGKTHTRPRCYIYFNVVIIIVNMSDSLNFLEAMQEDVPMRTCLLPHRKLLFEPEDQKTTVSYLLKQQKCQAKLDESDCGSSKFVGCEHVRIVSSISLHYRDFQSPFSFMCAFFGCA